MRILKRYETMPGKVIPGALREAIHFQYRKLSDHTELSKSPSHRATAICGLLMFALDHPRNLTVNKLLSLEHDYNRTVPGANKETVFIVEKALEESTTLVYEEGAVVVPPPYHSLSTDLYHMYEKVMDHLKTILRPSPYDVIEYLAAWLKSAEAKP